MSKLSIWIVWFAVGGVIASSTAVWARGFETLAQTPEPVRSHALSRGEAQALSDTLAQIKVAITTYYFEHNALPLDSKPLSPNALGLDPQSAVSLTLRPHGEVVLTTASGARLYAIPTPSKTTLNWECVSPDLADVAVYLPGCRFDPAF